MPSRAVEVIMNDKPTKDEIIECTTYTVFRTGVRTKYVYQLNKLIMGVEVDDYWVELKTNGEVFCSCPGFLRQKFAHEDHKHVKIAQMYKAKGEPEGAVYKIHGTGANTTIERIQ